MKIPEELQVIEREPGQWCWCLHCERCYKWGEYRHERPSAKWQVLPPTDIYYCPYDDCNGDVVVDNWPWEQIAVANDYPAEPERGKVYPQYGTKKED